MDSIFPGKSNLTTSAHEITIGFGIALFEDFIVVYDGTVNLLIRRNGIYSVLTFE